MTRRALTALAVAITITTGCTMAETGAPRPDVSLAVWADGSGFARTEPAGAKKLAGYDPGTAIPPVPGEVPLATDHNWLFGFWADILRYHDAVLIREFADLNEAIVAIVNAPGVFRIGQPPAGNRAYGAQAYSLTPTGYTAIEDGASDGEQAYYIDPAGVYAANTDTGAQVWLTGPANITTSAVAADGRSVYVCGDAVTPGLTIINRTTGAVAGVAGTPPSASDIAANGQYAVMADGGVTLNAIYYYTVATSTPIETGSTSHGNFVLACAVDDLSAYFGGIRGTGSVDVRCHDLATRAAVWTSNINGTAAPAITSIETDGELVYVGGVRVALGAGFANLYVLQASDGAVIATADVQTGGSTDGIANIAIDGERIYCTMDGATASVIAMRLGAGGLYQAALMPTVTVAYDADGVGLVSSDGAGKAERYFVQTAPVTFERVQGQDVNRRPFHKLAIPMR